MPPSIPPFLPPSLPPSSWDDKIELAVHTGNVGSIYRKRLAAAAEKNPGEILVNELFIGDHGRITQTCRQIGKHDKGGYQKHQCL